MPVGGQIFELTRIVPEPKSLGGSRRGQDHLVLQIAQRQQLTGGPSGLAPHSVRRTTLGQGALDRIGGALPVEQTAERARRAELRVRGRSDAKQFEAPSLASTLRGGTQPAAAAVTENVIQRAVGVRDGKWKYITDEDGPEYLFDVLADPQERLNLIGAEKDLARRYERRIEDWTAFSENLIERYTEILGESGCNPRPPARGAP